MTRQSLFAAIALAAFTLAADAIHADTAPGARPIPAADAGAPRPASHRLQPGHADEFRAVFALRADAARRVAAVVARLASLPQGPEREALLRETATIKRDLRVRELYAIAAFARARGDEARAREAERALAPPKRPAAVTMVQTPVKREAAR